MKLLLDWINQYIDSDPLDQPLLKFSSDRIWTLRNAFEGTLILGANGSGKTSGSGRHIATAILKRGFAGLVLCVKPDEGGLWEKMCRETGRASDLVRIQIGSRHCFNPLESEKTTFNRVELLTKLVDLKSQSRTNITDGFWEKEAKRLLSHLITLATAVGSGADFMAFRAILDSLPHSVADTRSATWIRESSCGQALEQASRSGSQYVRESIDYFRRELPNTPDKQRAGYVSIVSSLLSTILDEGIRDLFTRPSTITPKKLIARRKIVVVDIPVETWNELGLFANMIWKLAFQRAVSARQGTTPECFLWADEAQFLLSKEDVNFQATTRSKGCATVFLSQNYSGIEANLGAVTAAQLTGVLKTKIFHQNDCPQTNKWASELVGYRSVVRESETNAPTMDGRRISTTAQVVREPRIQPEAFHEMKNGGPQNNKLVEGYVFFPRGRSNSTKIRKQVFRQL